MFFQLVTLDMVPAQFKAIEVPRPTADLEATGPMAGIMVVLGASLPQGSPMGDVGRARGLLNTSEGKTTLISLIDYKTINCLVKYFYFQGIHCSLQSCQHRCHRGTSRRLRYLHRRNRTHRTHCVGSDSEKCPRCCCHKRWPSKFLIEGRAK